MRVIDLQIHEVLTIIISNLALNAAALGLKEMTVGVFIFGEVG